MNISNELLQNDIHKMMMNINYDLITDNDKVYSVLVNNASLKDGIENKCPYVLNGYSFTSKPESSTIEAKLKWQNSILNILTEEETEYVKNDVKIVAMALQTLFEKDLTKKAMDEFLELARDMTIVTIINMCLEGDDSDNGTIKD